MFTFKFFICKFVLNLITTQESFLLFVIHYNAFINFGKCIFPFFFYRNLTTPNHQVILYRVCLSVNCNQEPNASIPIPVWYTSSMILAMNLAFFSLARVTSLSVASGTAVAAAIAMPSQSKMDVTPHIHWNFPPEMSWWFLFNTRDPLKDIVQITRCSEEVRPGTGRLPSQWPHELSTATSAIACPVATASTSIWIACMPRHLGCLRIRWSAQVLKQSKIGKLSSDESHQSERLTAIDVVN